MITNNIGGQDVVGIKEVKILTFKRKNLVSEEII